MSESKPSSAKADELAKQLKSSLVQRRPRPWKPVLITLFLSTLFLGLLAWRLYPRPHAPLLQVIAFDAVCTRDEKPAARAQLFAPPEDEKSRRLDGATIVFFEQQRLMQPMEKPREVAIRSDAQGQAVVDWPIEAKQPWAAFLVRHVDVGRREASPLDTGNLFVWPKDAPLLVVDADETLSVEEADAKAQETLRKAAEEGWHIIYLSLAAAKAVDFRETRNKIAGQALLPKGPVLGRRFYPSEDTTDQARREALKALQSRFTGPLVAVVKNADSAQASKDIGLRTILIGEAAAPAEVLRVPTWSEVPIRLK